MKNVDKGIQIRQGHQTYGRTFILHHHSELDLPNAEYQEPPSAATEDDAFQVKVLTEYSQTWQKSPYSLHV